MFFIVLFVVSSLIEGLPAVNAATKVQPTKVMTVQNKQINNITEDKTTQDNNVVITNSKDINVDSTVSDNVYTEFKPKRGDKSIVRELTEKRTENSKNYLLADGSYQSEISLGDIHYEDESGQLQDINTNLIDEGDIDLLEIPLSKEVSNEAKSISKDNKAKRKNNASSPL